MLVLTTVRAILTRPYMLTALLEYTNHFNLSDSIKQISKGQPDLLVASCVLFINVYVVISYSPVCTYIFHACCIHTYS